MSKSAAAALSPKQNEWRNFCRSFSRLHRFYHVRSNCLNRQVTKATGHGDTEKSFLYLDPTNGEQTKLQCDPIMPMSIEDINYKRINHLLLFPWGYQFTARFDYFCFYMVFFLMVIRMIFMNAFGYESRSIISFEAMIAESALATNRLEFRYLM